MGLVTVKVQVLAYHGGPSFLVITCLKTGFAQHVKAYSYSARNFTPEYEKKVGAKPLEIPVSTHYLYIARVAIAKSWGPQFFGHNLP